MALQCNPCSPVKDLPQCGTQERCSLCQCSKVDARVYLPCHHKFCASCLEKLLPPDCHTMTSCPICNCDAERLKAICSPEQTYRPADPCGDKGVCSPHSDPPCDEWYCYNCFTEGRCKVRAKEFCLDCDVSMCEKHLQQHVAFIKKKKHNILPVCQYKLMKRKFECRRCKLHPKYTLMFVCYKCNQIVCQVCVACNDCDAGGRHDVQELEVVAMDLASSINQGMKDVDCIRQQGMQVIEEGNNVCHRSECEMEKLKQCICSQFEEKSAELCRERQKILNQINDMICHNKKQTQCHKAQIQDILCEAKKATAKANQLLQYSHNVDIATDARCMLDELQSVKVTNFPCLELGKFNQCEAEKVWTLPSVTNDTEMKTFCPQPILPPPAVEDQCSPCSRPTSPCRPCTPPPCAPPAMPCRKPCYQPDCDPCKPCIDPCDPCEPCIDPCDPCKSGNDPFDPCNPCADPCDGSSSYPPCKPCPPLPCDPCLQPAFPSDLITGPKGRKETWFRFQIRDVCNFTTVHSGTFWIANLPWNVMAEIREVKKCDLDCNEYLAFFLQCNMDSKDPCWSCEAHAELKLINKVCDSNTFTRKIHHKFRADENDWGFSTFIKWCDAIDPCNGYLTDGSLLLEVHLAT